MHARLSRGLKESIHCICREGLNAVDMHFARWLRTRLGRTSENKKKGLLGSNNAVAEARNFFVPVVVVANKCEHARYRLKVIFSPANSKLCPYPLFFLGPAQQHFSKTTWKSSSDWYGF